MFKLKSDEKPRDIRIFISSTFEDMKLEREQLIKHTFPQLRSIAKSHGVEITEVDLRWGIDGEKVEKGDTIAVCINEIERSRPYFVGILGHRYGWIPNALLPDEIDEHRNERVAMLCARLKREEYSVYIEKLIREGRSVTDIEFQHGVLRSSETRSKARIYFRRESDYCDPEGSESASLLQGLKKAVSDKLFEHKPTEYSNITELHEAVLKDFKKFLVDDYPEHEKPNELHSVLSGHKSFARTRLSVWEGAGALLDKLESLVQENASHVVVTGPGGLGKTALLAHCIAQHQDYGDDVFYLFCGGGPGATKWPAMMRLLLEQIVDYYSLSDKVKIPPHNVELSDALVEILSTHLINQQLILVLDGLDQLEDAGDLNWWPDQKKFSENVVTVLGVRCGKLADILIARGLAFITMQPIDESDRKVIIRKVLKNYSRSLGQKLINEIAADKESENPLVLRTLLEELKAHGDNVNLEECVHWYIDTDSNEDFFSRVIERLTRDYEAASKVLPLIGASIVGLSETEIREIAELESHLAWSELYDVLAPHIANRDGYLVYSHDFIRQAVARNFYPNKEDIHQYQQKLIDYFTDPARRLERRALKEWPELYARMGNVAGLLHRDTIRNLYDYDADQENPRLVSILNTCLDNGGDIVQYLLNRNFVLNSKDDVFAEDTLAMIPYLINKCQVCVELLEKIWSIIDSKDIEIRQGEMGNKKNWYHESKVLIANNLGVAYGFCGNRERSKFYLELSVESVFEFPSIHEIAQRLNNLANLLSHEGGFRYTTLLHKCALDLYTVLNKSKFENRLYGTWYHISLVYWENGEYDMAIMALKKALDGYRKLYGNDHPDTIKCEREYESFRHRLSRWENVSIEDEMPRLDNLSTKDINQIKNLHNEYSEKAWIDSRRRNDFESAEKWLQSALELSELIPDFEDSKTRIRLAVIRQTAGKESIPVNKLKNWIELCDNDGLKKQARRLIKLSEDACYDKKAFIQNSILSGRAYFACGIIQKGIEVLSEAQNYAKGELNEIEGDDAVLFKNYISEIENLLVTKDENMNADVMESCGMIAKAIEKKSLDYVNDKSAFNAHNYAESCINVGNLELAIKLEEEALKGFREVNNQDGMARAYGNLGRICHLVGKYAESMGYHKKEEKIALEINDHDVLAESLWNQSIMLRRQGRYQDAVLTAQRGQAGLGDRKWNTCCQIEELFNKTLVCDLHLESAISSMEEQLKKIEYNFAQGHWLGSSYLACLLQKAGHTERALIIWNEILTKAQCNGFKLIEMEMEELKNVGFWK